MMQGWYLTDKLRFSTKIIIYKNPKSTSHIFRNGPRRNLIQSPWTRRDVGRFGLPDGCPAGNLKVLELSRPYHYMLTDVGTLVSLGGAYEIDLDLGDFCVDWLHSASLGVSYKDGKNFYNIWEE